MLFGDKEKELVGILQMMSEFENPCFLPKYTKKARQIFNLIANVEQWQEWTDSSGTGDPPPDYYCDKYHIMMDIMRVDDHERKGKKGKLYNPAKQHEREIYNELIKQNPTIKDATVIINGLTELSTYEDHDYTFYKKNFKRILQKHIDSIPLYKKNHPGYKLVFLIYDESTAYYQAPFEIDKKRQPMFGEMWIGDPHLYYNDAEFIDIFVNSEIDYLVWFAPYKLLNSITIPRICVFDLHQKKFKMKQYIEQNMGSVEL